MITMRRLEFEEFYLKMKLMLKGPDEKIYSNEEFYEFLDEVNIKYDERYTTLTNYHIPDELYVRITFGFNE